MTKYLGSRRLPCGHHFIKESTVDSLGVGKHSERCDTCKTYWVLTIEEAKLNGRFNGIDLRKITWGTS